MTDIIDELDRLHAELEQAVGELASYDGNDEQLIAAMQRKAALRMAALSPVIGKHWPAISARLREAERKAQCFDAIAQAWVENRFSLTIGADNEDGFVDIDSLEPTDTPETLLTAIEAALAAKETKQ